MKKALLIFALAIIVNLTFAQRNLEDVVYLKNGSIIRGVVVELLPTQTVKIETVDRNVFVFQMAEVEKIIKEPRHGQTKVAVNNASETRFKGIVEFGYENKIGDFGLDRVKLNLIGARQINSYTSIGLGAGIRHYTNDDVTLVPVFADFRGYFTNNNILPYVALQVGYSFCVTKFNEAGFLLEPSAGVSFALSGNKRMNLGVGYSMQKLEAYTSYESFNVNSGAISIHVGFEF